MSDLDEELNLEAPSEHQQSFFLTRDEDADIPPSQLSGDENGEQSVFSVLESDKKASNHRLT